MEDWSVQGEIGAGRVAVASLGDRQRRPARNRRCRQAALRSSGQAALHRGGDEMATHATLPSSAAAALAAVSGQFFVLHSSFASSVRLSGCKHVARSKACGLLFPSVRLIRSMSCSRGSMRTLIAAITLLFFLAGHSTAQDEKDPHRPACRDAQCRRTKTFLKSHYCGESPFGNGPDDGCEIKLPKKLSDDIKVRADYRCTWNQSKGTNDCEQSGQPSDAVRMALMTGLRRLGLSQSPRGKTYFRVWESMVPEWTLA